LLIKIAVPTIKKKCLKIALNMVMIAVKKSEDCRVSQVISLANTAKKM
jgi:hypothetical protein